MTEPTIVVWDEIEDWSEFKAEVLKIATADPRNVAKRDELATKAEAKWHGAHDAVFGIYAGALAKVEAEEAEAAAKLEVVVAPLEKAEPKIKRRKVAVPPVGPKADFAGALAAMIAARRAKETEAKPDGR